MDYEFKVEIANKNYIVFLQPGFYNMRMFSPSLHKHNYPEIHLFLDGNVCINVDQQSHMLSSGEFCIVPPNAYHCFDFADKGTLHIAWQVDLPCTAFQKSAFSTLTASDFIKAIHEKNYTKIASHIALICSQFMTDTTEPPRVCKDYAFIISEFFSTNYDQNVRLENLADKLHLSGKQTARLVKKYTGYTFNEAVTVHRMKTADFLLKSKKMPLTEIAAYVGYQSYSGFWRAYQKHKNNP